MHRATHERVFEAARRRHIENVDIEDERVRIHEESVREKLDILDDIHELAGVLATRATARQIAPDRHLGRFIPVFWPIIHKTRHWRKEFDTPVWDVYRTPVSPPPLRPLKKDEPPVVVANLGQTFLARGIVLDRDGQTYTYQAAGPQGGPRIIPVADTMPVPRDVESPDFISPWPYPGPTAETNIKLEWIMDRLADFAIDRDLTTP